MFGIGGNELILILIFGFIIFGPDKLPAMAKTIGQAIAKFRRAQNEMSNVLKNEVFDPTAEDPFKNPLDAMARLEKGAKEKQESFSENKARYDRQREAQRRNEERKAQLAQKKAQARARMQEEGSLPVQASAEAAEPASVVQAAPAAPAISVEALYGIEPESAPAAEPEETPLLAGGAGSAPAISIDELYGIVPVTDGDADDASAQQTGKGE